MKRSLQFKGVYCVRVCGTALVLLSLLIAAVAFPSPSHAATRTVTTPADDGPGSLRQALQEAQPGDVIVFDPAVFPPDNPVTISVLSPLPPLSQGNVTIDASNAGVILDGSVMVASFETLLLDDISLTFDGGENQLVNGDFSQGLAHWIYSASNSEQFSQSLSSDDYRSAPNAFAQTMSGRVGGNGINYDASGQSGQQPDNSWPYYEGSGVWIPAPAGAAAQVRLWYKGWGVAFQFQALYPDGRSDWFGGYTGFPPADDWTEAVVDVEVPADATHMAISLAQIHSSAAPGLHLPSDGNVIKGLAILSFQNGIQVSGSGNRIGGRNATPGQGCSGECNLISQNFGFGVSIDAPASETIVSGNYIGTDRSGAPTAGNLYGIFAGSVRNTIGGLEEGEGNLIDGNELAGLSLNVGANNNVVSGNTFGDSLGISGADNQIGPRNIFQGTPIAIGDLAININVAGNHIFENVIVGCPTNGIMLGNGASGNRIGPGNIIRDGQGSGIVVDGSNTTGNTVTQNSIFNNTTGAIVLLNSANGDPAAPVIVLANAKRIEGTAPPGAQVELFTDDEDEAEVYLGTAQAGDDGRFVFAVPDAALLKRNITATATDAQDNTSPFSAAFGVAAPTPVPPTPTFTPTPTPTPAPVFVQAPLDIPRPQEVSVDPVVVGTNVVLAVFCAIFFALTSSVFNNILEEHAQEMAEMVQRLAPAGLRKRLPAWPASFTWRQVVGIGLGFTLVAALIESFLDPGPLFTVERLGLVIGIFISGLLVSGLELGGDWLARRHLDPQQKVTATAQWFGMVLAVGSVILSRAMRFTPGYVYGIVGVLALLPEVEERVKAGKRGLIVIATVLVGALAAWLLSPLFTHRAPDVEAFLLTVFLIGLQYAFFGLLPLSMVEGGDIWKWNKVVWAVAFGLVTFGNQHFIFNPSSSSVQMLRENGVQTLLLLVIVFGLLTFGLWLAFPFRLRKKAKASET